MDIRAMIKEVQSQVIDTAMKEQIRRRLKEAEEKFSEEARARRATDEFLRRTYDI